MTKWLLASMATLCLGLPLGSCSQTSGYIADHWPHWAGGMPDDVPPRPGAPGYEDFIAHKQTAKDAASTPTVAGAKKDAQAASSSNHPVNEKDTVQGGLY